MNELQIFQNKQFGNLEILTIEGKEWFPAIKVAEILGYTNPRKAIRDHTKERGVTIRSVIDKLGRKQNKKFIDEGNLYRLITRSKLPQVDEFEEWVFEEVLPQIRRTGTYSINPTIQELANNPELIKMLVEQIARLNDSTTNQSKDLDYLKQAVTGEYVTPQDIVAIKYAITNKAEKFVEGLGVQLSLDDVMTVDVYELAKENKRQEQQKNYHIGKAKSRLLVLTKKHLGMKGNAPNNHIKRKDVDLAIQFIKDVRPSAIEI
ncbi:MAG: BRO family protein [Staphylococcus sp.]|uniref:BRO-N domain-containing protein n=1 Tax=Staphylococcus hominis TaxID=1290 RepID=UPI000923FE80|nr:BRO family protein [Staphylococcus hominis]MDU7693972.1 BRO family protein [Staphylococcus sp.]SFX65589.1 BRO family, N-terminal domain [Staphylococcus hominis]